MHIGQFVLPIVFVLFTASPSLSQETAKNSTGMSDLNNENITLAEALNLVQKQNPSLAALTDEIRARGAAVMQAGLLPNPDFSLEVENFAGQDALQGFDSAETTITLSQLVELGGKRSKRRQLATLEKDLADWDYRSKNLDLLAATAKTFVQLLSLQEKVSQSEELLKLSEHTLAVVGERVDAGKVSPVERIRAQVELAAMRNKHNKTRRELVSARRRLGSFWGAKQVSFEQAVGDISRLAQLPPEENIKNKLTNNPDLARWSNELEQRKAAVELERAQAVSDLTVSVGVRNFRDSDSNALVAGIEIPLAIFDRNQGGVDGAQAQLEKARHNRRAAENEAQTALKEAWQELSAAHEEASVLRNEIIPGAQSVFDAMELGYREGKFNFLQLLDAQRTLFEVKGQSLQALTSYYQARIEIDRLTGSPIQNLLQPATNLPQDLR